MVSQAVFQAKIFASRSGPFSLTEDQFSPNTYFYKIASRLPHAAHVPAEPADGQVGRQGDQPARRGGIQGGSRVWPDELSIYRVVHLVDDKLTLE